MSKSCKQWSVEDVEITGFWAVSSGGRNRPLSKHSRREELRQETVSLRHVPTGLAGQIEIPAGHYTKKEMQRLREATKGQFLQRLINQRSG